VTRRTGDRPPLTLEQRRQRFWEQERRDAAVYARLTKAQRQQPRWRHRAAQWENAAKLALILGLAGDELPEPLARMFAPPPATGLFASHLADVPRRGAGGTPWGSAWGSPWSRTSWQDR
jgi:hypothetical protein